MAKPKDKAGKKSKRPYTVTEKVINACRANSKFSTGPKGAEAKKRVGQNSRTHGLTCEEALVIDGEDPKELQAMGDFWVASAAAETPIEIHLARQSSVFGWRLRRAIHSEAAALRGQLLAAARTTASARPARRPGSRRNWLRHPVIR